MIIQAVQLIMLFNILEFILVWCLCTGTTIASSDLKCNVRARIESGWVCGLLREAELGVKYASFRGVPYGQQPLGELRFKELQPVKPWLHHLDATEEGPVCPQHDMLYGNLVNPVRGMSESCIHANIHVPFTALPVVERADVQFEEYMNRSNAKSGCPIFVFIHGGGFVAGSGDADINGPEYLVSKGFMVITFNYRLNVFGFLSLNSPKIPGNAGLRDQVTLLRWVQRNARAFGGDPSEVTLAGQSAGGANAHLLALSEPARGLFKRVILMSGTAITAFYTASPVYANMIAASFLNNLGINSTDPDFIHDQLVNIPLERIINANSAVQDQYGLATFSPVIEGKYPGVTRIVDDNPLNLIRRGRDKHYPMMVGFANNECGLIRRLLENMQMLRRIKENPAMILAAGIPYSTTPNVARELGEKIIARYFHGKMNYDEYMFACRDVLFEYPAFQLVRARAAISAAPSFLYQFAYESDFSVLKAGLNIDYRGSAHVEDMTYVLRENVILGDHRSFPPQNRDDHMKDWMTTFVVNFMKCNDPSCGKGWPAVYNQSLIYQLLHQPGLYYPTYPTPAEWDLISFHDKINQIGRGAMNI